MRQSLRVAREAGIAPERCARFHACFHLSPLPAALIAARSSQATLLNFAANVLVTDAADSVFFAFCMTIGRCCQKSSVEADLSRQSLATIDWDSRQLNPMPIRLSGTFITARRRRHLLALLMGCALVCLFNQGCTRDQYRCWADRDAYGLLRSRQFDPRWTLPNRTVEPDPMSRLADCNDPDCGPLPPDDPASMCYMRHPYRSRRRVNYWDWRGASRAVDSEHWLQYLPMNEDGEVVIDKQLAVNLALLHNRDFQTQVEQLHASALALSANRFEFDLNWLGGNSTSFAADGDGMDAVRDLGTSNSLGFNRNLAAGGQFAANLVNSFTWNLGGSGASNLAVGNLLFSLTQPLLRGAFRHVRTESLTQAERNLLYDVRSFARFRREFYFDIVSQYLDLLNQAQAVQIEQENLSNLQNNLDLHYLLAEQGEASTVRVDQVFQQFQSGRLSLINSQQSLQTAEDQFKFFAGVARAGENQDRGQLTRFI